MSKLTSQLEEISELVAEASTLATADAADAQELRLELKTASKGSSSSPRSKVAQKRKGSISSMSTADMAAEVCVLLRALSAKGEIVAIEHKALSKNYDETDVLNRYAIPEILILGEPEKDWEHNGRTCFVKE
jgi:hypothetical protein